MKNARVLIRTNGCRNKLFLNTVRRHGIILGEPKNGTHKNLRLQNLQSL